MRSKDTKLDFTGKDVFIGLDVHKKDWKVSIIVEDVLHKRFSQPASAIALCNYLRRNFPNANYHTAYEAGFCGYWIHRELEDLGINSIVVSPADIPTSDKERRQKEDKRDSLKIARSLKNKDLEAIYIPCERTIEDRFLLRTRERLSRDLRRNKNRIKSSLNFYGIEIPQEYNNRSGYWSKGFIDWIASIKLKHGTANMAMESILSQVKHTRAEILRLNKQIRKLSETEPYVKKVQLLITVPGIACLTAMKILTELENIERFKNIDKLCSYIGFIPSMNSSGDKDRMGSITPRGHHELRNVFIEMAWSAMRSDPALLLKYKELTKRMSPNKAITRIAKALIRRVVYVLKNNKSYEKGIVK